MSNPLITLFDVESQTEITREMTEEEFAAYQAAKTESTNAIAEQEEADAANQAKKDAAAAVLEKLGITKDVLDLLTK